VRHVKRLGVVVATVAIVAQGMAAAPATPARPKINAPYTASAAVKINIMGSWAHPDDDVGFIGMCGVWHYQFGVKCGEILTTRGEGGGNAVGPEQFAPLAIRRENEDRSAHYRSGTVDIWNTETVDFFYNQSAPLTEFFWNHDETLCKYTRIIRMTQPDIFMGFAPTLAVGHGNHQVAGRLIWEGALAAADPTMCADQLTGPHALSTWQIKKVFSGGSVSGTGGTAGPDCNTGFTPSGPNTVYGVWTGYDSPYLWPLGNIEGGAPGTPKNWATVAAEGGMAHATQSRSMWMAQGTPGCDRGGFLGLLGGSTAMTLSYVPFQPNGAMVGGVEYAGKDNGILYGASLPDPGGLPLGTLEYLTFSRFYNVAGDPFNVTLHAKSGSGTLPAGSVSLTVPSGWTVDSATKPIGPISSSSESTVTFTVTPAANAGTGLNKISALLTSGSATGYTDNLMQIVPPTEGRFHRFGNWAEYDQWVTQRVPEAGQLGRSEAVASMASGETISFSVDVHNWSDVPQSGTVTLTVPSGFAADATSKPYGPLASGADTSVAFTLTNTVTTLATSNTTNGQTYSVGIATSYSMPSGSASDDLTVSLVPATTIPHAAAAPTLDGAEGTGEYTGPALDLGTSWQGAPCAPPGVNCGSTGAVGGPTSTYAKVAWRNDALYLFIHVRDDYQSYASKPEECFAHWLNDSVEILLDPRGNSSQNLRDTGTTFKLGIFPFTNDPANYNGLGANALCWERDADNHQGFSVGPLAATVKNPPNAPGVQVVSTAVWVGDNQTTTPHSYGAAGGYNLEVKIPLADLPAAVGPTDTPPTGSAATNVADPLHMGLNITPYDADNSAAPGTTTLRRGDLVSMLASTRLAWSAYGSVQSDPWRWGHAYLDGYTPPSNRPTTPPDPIVKDALKGVDSPQTIYQSAVDGVPIAGLPLSYSVDSISAALEATSVEVDLHATGPGTSHVFLWDGVNGPPFDAHQSIPVWVTSCTKANDPPPDYGFTACSATDGTTPPWAPDMSGRVVGDQVVSVVSGDNHFSIPITTAGHDRLAFDGSALVSFEEASRANQAFDLERADLSVTKTDSPDPVSAGQNLTYTVTVHNSGPFAAPAVSLRDTLPSNVTLVSATPSQGGPCTGTVTCALGTIAKDADATVTIVVKPTAVGTITNTATASSATLELNASNNTATAISTVTGCPGFSSDPRTQIVGTTGNDTLTGTSGNDVICGLGGNDTMRGLGGNDLLLGGGGKDTLLGGAGNDVFDGGTGVDTVSFADGPVASGVTANLATGTSTNAQLGNDTFVAVSPGGCSTVENLTGSGFNDSFTGDACNNTLYGANGADTLTGGGGADLLQGVAGADSLSGGDGSDLLEPGTGDDLAADGGAGFDTLAYVDVTTGGVNINLVGGTATGTTTGGAGSDHFTASTFEAYYGTNQADTLTGDTGSNLLYGLGGADAISGGGGNDTMGGGAGADSIDGGGGVDSSTYYTAPGGATVNLGSGTASNDGTGSADSLTSVENALGSNAGNDSITGSAGSNALYGFGANDSLSGLAGNDYLDGGAGTDTLDGGDGTDRCLNGEGTLTGCEATTSPLTGSSGLSVAFIIRAEARMARLLGA
jgi:uncharacterized repeat protein (TIGR01451 family)